MSDSEWKKFKELGGPRWLRRFMGARPERYFEVFQHPLEKANG